MPSFNLLNHDAVALNAAKQLLNGRRPLNRDAVALNGAQRL